MHLKTIMAAGLLCSATLAPSFAQSANVADPSGTFRDRYGTTFTFALCGDGTDLCGVLDNVQGRSRTTRNLAYVGQQVMQAEQSGQSRWQGTVVYNGRPASATITQTDADTIQIRGCRGIFCQTLRFNRVS